MLDIFIAVATAASKIGSITAAYMYPSGLITIDGIANDGKAFSVAFRLVDTKENADGNP